MKTTIAFIWAAAASTLLAVGVLAYALELLPFWVTAAAVGYVAFVATLAVVLVPR